MRPPIDSDHLFSKPQYNIIFIGQLIIDKATVFLFKLNVQIL